MIWTKYLLTPGQEASVGVPNCLNVRNSWSISESPGKSGCRLTCHQLSNELSHQISFKDYHLHKDTAQAPGVHCSGVELGAKKNLWCPGTFVEILYMWSCCATINSHTSKICHTCTRGWPLRGCSSWLEHWRSWPSQSLPAWSRPSSSPASFVVSSPWISAY